MEKTRKQIKRCRLTIAKLHSKKQAEIGHKLSYKDVANSLNIDYNRFRRLIGGWEKKLEWQQKIADYYGAKLTSVFPKNGD